MLVLTRKLMERLYIGDDICVTVVRLEGGQVRLGIDAPRHVPVVRGELPRKDRNQGAEARSVPEAPRVPAPGASAPAMGLRLPAAAIPEIGIRRRARSR
jgi:carbon storage regulator